MLLFFWTFPADAQFSTKGKDFWMSYMDILPASPPVLTIMITSDVATSGTISAPLLGQSYNFTVVPNVTQIITIDTSAGLNTETETITLRGIHITSRDDINVFALNYVPTVYEATLVFPTSSLGSSYYVASMEPTIVGATNTESAASEFLIVGVVNDTKVEITPKAATIGGNAANVPFTVTLNAGQVYQVKSIYDLTGSYVRTVASGIVLKRKPIAVFSGNRCTNVGVGTDKGYCNHLWEQLYPTNAWGSTYITSPLAGRDAALYRIISYSDNNNVTFDGVSIGNINRGQFVEKMITTAGIISGSNPISVAQYSNSGGYDSKIGDPFMIMLSPIDQTRDLVQFHVNGEGSISSNFVNVVIPTSCVNDVTLDGLSAASTFQPLASDNTYSYAQIQVAVGSHTLKSSPGCGFNAYVYGFGVDDSYGYSGGSKIDTSSILSVGNCAGNSTTFSVRAKWIVAGYDWSFGDGGKSTLAYPTHTYAKGGTYTVQCMVTREGTGEKETIKMDVTIDDLTPDFSSSQSGTNALSFTDKSVTSGTLVYWLWEFGDGNYDFTQNPSHTYSNSGNYQAKLTVITENGCTGTITKTVNAGILTASATVIVKQDSCVEVGAGFNLPLILVNSTGLSGLQANKFKATIKFNAKIILPAKSVSTTSYRFVGDVCYFDITGTRTDSVNALLGSFPLVALLGDMETGIISIDSFEWLDVNDRPITSVNIQTANTNFCIKNLCKAGGTRFYINQLLDKLSQNAPNPVKNSTKIEYDVAETGYVKLYITDILGKEMKIIFEGEQSAGTHSLTFDASPLQQGSYYYTLQTPGNSITRTMEVVK